MTVRPGSFCSPPGASGATAIGTPMTCSAREPGERARWRAVDADPTVVNRRAERRRLLAEARAAGVWVPRGLPDVAVREMINLAAVRLMTVDERIRSAIVELEQGRGAIADVTLVDLRSKLADVSRERVDQALLKLDRERVIQLEPYSLRWQVTEADREGSLPLGGELMHLVYLVEREGLL